MRSVLMLSPLGSARVLFTFTPTVISEPAGCLAKKIAGELVGNN